METVYHTERLSVRPLTRTDAPDLARIGGDARVAPMIFAATVPWSVEGAERLIARDQWTGRLGFRLAILKDDDLIGTIAAFPDANIAYFLAPDVWGKGYATEAVRGFLDRLVPAFGLPSVGADVFVENTGSARVLSKLGFKQMGYAWGTSAARPAPAPVKLFRRFS